MGISEKGGQSVPGLTGQLLRQVEMKVKCCQIWIFKKKNQKLKIYIFTWTLSILRCWPLAQIPDPFLQIADEAVAEQWGKGEGGKERVPVFPGDIESLHLVNLVSFKFAYVFWSGSIKRLWKIPVAVVGNKNEISSFPLCKICKVISSISSLISFRRKGIITYRKYKVPKINSSSDSATVLKFCFFFPVLNMHACLMLSYLEMFFLFSLLYRLR